MSHDGKSCLVQIPVCWDFRWFQLIMCKSTKVPLNLYLDNTRFLAIYHREWPTLCSQRLWNVKGRPEKLRPLVSLSTFSCLLTVDVMGTPTSNPQRLASSGQNALLKQSSHKKIVDTCSTMSIWWCLNFEICSDSAHLQNLLDVPFESGRVPRHCTLCIR